MTRCETKALDPETTKPISPRDGKGGRNGFRSKVAKSATLSRLRPKRSAAKERVVGPVKDLLDRLARGDGFLEGLSEHFPVGIAVVQGLRSRYTFANAVYRSLMGRQDEPLVGRTFFEALPDVGASGSPPLLEEVYRTGKAVRAREFRASLGPGREETYWHVDYLPLRLADRRSTAIVILAYEVTREVAARKLLEDLTARLAESRRFLSTILENIPVGVTYLDGGLVYRQCNAAAARHLGRRVDEILGRHLHELMPSSPAIWNAAEEVLRTGAPFHERVLPVKWADRPAEPERHYLVSYLPDKDELGAVRGVFGEARDITELIETREALEAERVRLATILATLPVGVITLDANGRALDMNRTFARIWGGMAPFPSQPPTNVAGIAPDKGWWVDSGRPIAPEEWPAVRALRRGEAIAGELAEIERFDGTRAAILSSATPVRNAQSEITGTVVAILDVTQRRQAEKNLQNALGELHGSHQELKMQAAELEGVNLELQRQTQELEALNEELRRQAGELRARSGELERARAEAERRAAEAQEAVRARDEFVARVSDELRRPLAAVQAGLEALRRAPAPGARTAASMLEDVERNVDRQARLLDNLVSLSRPKREKE